jgi:D-alanine-D-alanine ligase
MKIAVLHGSMTDLAPLDEQDGLIQVEAVCRALSDLGHEPVQMNFSLDVQKSIHDFRRIQPDIVFNLVETIDGQGRLIHLPPSVMESMSLAYTGASTDAMFTTSNKVIAKKMLMGAGIPTPAFVTVDTFSRKYNLEAIPCIIKSVWEHGSVGLDGDCVVFINTADQLNQKMDALRNRLGGECFAESYIDGREFNLSLISENGNGSVQILPPAEIRFVDYPEEKRQIVDYQAKWNDDSFEYHHTVRSFRFEDSDRLLLGKMKNIARECWKLFGLRGYARVDFRVDSDGHPWVLEVNANPCISPDSGFVAAADRAGFTFTHIVERIIDGPFYTHQMISVKKSNEESWKIAVNQ